MNEFDSLKKDFVTALRIIDHEKLSDAFAHLSARSKQRQEMLFMPRKSPALVKSDELFFVDFEKAVPQSSLHQAIYKSRDDVKAVFHFHSPAVILLSVLGQTIRPIHNYSAVFYAGVPIYVGTGQVAGKRQGLDPARPWRGRRGRIDSGSLHPGAFPGGISAASNRSDAPRRPDVHRPR